MRGTRAALVVALSVVLMTGAFARASVEESVISETRGVVQVRPKGGRWVIVRKVPRPLNAGDEIRTGTRARATINIWDGSRLSMGADASFSIEEASPRRSAFRLYLGPLKVEVRRAARRRFEVRTPTAVCYVRGTEFRLNVLSNGRTLVDLYKGLLGVEDNGGRQILLHPNERLSVDRRGMGVPQRVPTGGEVRRSRARESVRREIRLDMTRESLLDAAAREIKLGEYQQGKALIDVHGRRVRVEEYIIRPRADQFKFVVLNKRDGRIDYFYYLGTFNAALPTDLSSALRLLRGSVDSSPGTWLTGFETGRSNTTDSILEIGEGGHPVDVNNNGDADDDVAYFYDGGTGGFEDVSDRSVFLTLFDRYGLYLNGKLKYGWRGTNIDSNSDATESSNTDPISGAALTSANAYLDGTGFLASRSVSVTYPDSQSMHQRVYESYSDGAFLSWDNYIIRDNGEVAKLGDFSGITSGAGFEAKLLDFNYEQVITASEFNGRSIDLVVEPRILIESGLIQ